MARVRLETRGLLISSQALYHWAPPSPFVLLIKVVKSLSVCLKKIHILEAWLLNISLGGFVEMTDIML